MTPTETLDELQRRGVILELNEGRLHYRAPRGVLTAELLEAMQKHKCEILTAIRRYGDGQPPALDRPIADEQELRRWMDWTAYPEKFARWLEWAMNNPDLSGR